MREVDFKLPIILSIPIEFVALLLALMTTGAGHGTYIVAALLFPYMMISTAAYETITEPFVVLTLLQFPIYGLILALFTRSKAGFVYAAKLLGAIHVCTAALALIVMGSSFKP